VFWSASGPVHYLHLLLRRHLHKARTAQDRGASAIEWVIISAILVVIAGGIGTIIYNKVVAKANSINLDTGP
jgi:hypothetical protein